MKIWIASDHAGLELKNKLVQVLQKNQQDEIFDLGPNSTESVDYPDFADLVSQQLNKSIQITQPTLWNEFGILICGSGQGMALRANKYPFIRAALVYSDEICKLAREHNNANILCIGARFCSLEQAAHWVEIFKKTHFAGGRHQTRVAKVSSPIS